MPQINPSDLMNYVVQPGANVAYDDIVDNYDALNQWTTVPRTIDKNPTESDSFLEKQVGKIFHPGQPARLDPTFLRDFLAANNIPFPSTFVFSDPKSLVGIEVEVENVLKIDPGIPICFWKIEQDGSLRNHGREFKTWAIPVQYAQIALTQLFNGLNPDIDFSARTSVHVHVDVRSFTIKQLLILLFVYAVMENILFKFAGGNRRNNIFCTPITETKLFQNLDITNGRVIQNHFNTVWQKYTALNLLPISKFGTVEFRQMPGNADIQKLCIWIDLLSRIRLYAYKTSFEDVINIISDLNTNSQYRKFVESVFGELTGFLDTTSLLVDMEKAVYLIKNCTAINSFHQQVLASKDPESSFIKAIGGSSGLASMPPEIYALLQRLRQECGTSGSDISLCRTIKKRLNDYTGAFPHYILLFQWLATNKI